MKGIRKFLRQRFRVEYLGQLSRKCPKYQAENVKLGEVVVISNDSTKRLFRLTTGEDNKIDFWKRWRISSSS